MLLCVGNFFGSTSETEWAEYRTGAKKGKEGVVALDAGDYAISRPTPLSHCSVLWNSEVAVTCCDVKAVKLKQENSTQDRKMGLF